MFRKRSLLSIVLLWHSTEAFHSQRNGKGPRRVSRTNNNIPESSSTSLNAAKRFKNFEHVLDTFQEEPVMIYFSTVNCGPCRLMEKELKTVRKLVGDDMKIFSLDTEKWPSVGSRFEVATLPCLVVFEKGEIKMRMEGVNAAESIVEQIGVFL